MTVGVILTHSRQDDYRDCLAALRPQVNWLVVVSHKAPYVKSWDADQVIYYEDEVCNISRAWNLGLHWAKAVAGGQPYDVAVLNDDAIVSPDWLAQVTAAMREQGAVAGSGAKGGGDGRLAGYAYVLDGAADLWLDEQFQWWYGDDDLERRARMIGGVALPDVPVEHRHPNGHTVGVLSDIAGEDRLRYERKWA
jgi:GT2 family glycosyltransferase